jgi:hypothetical protein
MICKNCGRENPPEAVYCINCGTRLVTATAPVPGIGSSFGHGWQTLWKNFWELVLAGVIYVALLLPVFMVLVLIVSFTIEPLLSFDDSLSRNILSTATWQTQLASGIINIFYATPLVFGLMFVYLGTVRGEKVKYGNIFAAFQNYPDVLLVGFIYTVISTGMSFLLTFIAAHSPVLGALLALAWFVFSIFLVCKLAFVPYLLLDRHLKAIEAIRTAWNMSAGHAWKVFLIGLFSVLMLVAVAIVAALLSLIFFWVPFIGIFIGILVGTIGAIVLAMWLLTTYGSLYYAVSGAAPAVDITPVT